MSDTASFDAAQHETIEFQSRTVYREVVPKLDVPALHYVRAARGWLELGNLAEAAAELQRLSPEDTTHAEVLELHWEICCREARWQQAMAVSQRMTELYPDLPSGWIGRSYSLHELKRTEEALDLLLPAAKRFPGIGVIPYNLACYFTQLRRIERAKPWLLQAIQISGKDEIKRMAASDPDLVPLRDWISTL